MNIIQDDYFCKMFINNDSEINDNQVSIGAFQDTSSVIVGMNIIKLEAGKNTCPIQS